MQMRVIAIFALALTAAAIRSDVRLRAGKVEQPPQGKLNPEPATKKDSLNQRAEDALQAAEEAVEKAKAGIAQRAQDAPKKPPAKKPPAKKPPPGKMAPAKKVVTCELTIDNVLEKVYYNDLDITTTVTGDLNSWVATKKFEVTPVLGAYLVVSGRNLEGNSCQTAGFAIQCSNGVTTASGWEAVSDPNSVHGDALKGQGSGWATPCTSTSAFSLPTHPETAKIWATDENGAAFRMKLVKDAPKKPPAKPPPAKPPPGKMAPAKKQEDFETTTTTKLPEVEAK